MPQGRYYAQGDDLPSSYQDIGAVAVRSHGNGTVVVYLSICDYENKVVLFVTTTGDSKGNILLRWGEGPDTKKVYLRGQA